MTSLEDLYARVPAVECRGKCQNACGPIDCSTAEREAVRAAGVELPEFSSERAVEWAADRRVSADGSSLVCPALGGLGQCRVYAVRPLVCRIWGAAESMPCEHGCRPARYLNDAEAMELLFESFRVGGHPKFDDAILREVAAVLADPDVAPIHARFIRGDDMARDELERMVLLKLRRL